MNLSFSHVEKIQKNGLVQIIKRANKDELVTTTEQINYLLNLPKELKNIFPSILEYYIGEEVWYTMPFYSLLSLDDALYKTDIPISTLEMVFKELINTIFDKMYVHNIQKAPRDYITKTHFERIQKRLKYLCYIRPDLSALIHSNTIYVNGVKKLNALTLLDMLKERTDLLNKLSPNFLGLIHGDLETNHILFDIDENKKVKLILLDPRMPLDGGDYTYDLGKLWQSLDGEIGSLIRGLFTLSYNTIKGKHDFNFVVNNLREETELNSLQKYVFNIVNKKILSLDDNWYYRCLFSQAAHFLSAPPFFVDKKYPEKLAEALYITGVIQLNNLFERMIKNDQSFI